MSERADRDPESPNSGHHAAEARLHELQHRLITLLGASSTLFGSPKLDDVMTGILALARAFLPADGYAIWRLDPVAKEWHVGASSGISDQFAHRIIRSFAGEPAAIVSFSEPLVAEDVESMSTLSERRVAYREEGIRSMLAVPLQIAGRGTGTLVLYYRTPHQFDDLDVQTAQALGSLSAAAVTTAELYDAQQRSRELAEHENRQAEFLAQASAALASSLDYEATLRTVAHLAVPHIADWCAVHIVDEQGEIRCVAVAHVDPKKVALARALQEQFPDDPKVPNRVHSTIESGQPSLIAEVPEELLARLGRSAEQIEVIRALSITSQICVPLSVRGRTLGAITFVSAESKRRYTDDDLRFAQDVAFRSALAVENARVYSHANAANRAKDEFLATLSHELRTPLNAVLGWTRMLRSGAVPPAKVARALEVIEHNANAQVRLVEDLLDLSRIITGKFRLDVQMMHLASSLEAAVAAVQPAATAKNIAVEVVADGEGALYGDPQRLQQVVWNLLSNAVKFTPAGGRVKAELRAEAGEIVVNVTDTGEGIAPDVLPFVFDRFRQADSGTTRSHMGLGLGLAIVRHIVELHGGRVSVVSDGVGRGATFRLALPALATGPRASGEPEGPSAEPGVTPHSNARVARLAAGLRVLVVDDDEGALLLLVELLSQHAIDVRTAGSVDDALWEIARDPPDVIVTDIAMPGRDGYDLIKEVRERVKTPVPVLALSAYARAEDRARSARSGFAAHLAKPLDVDELLAAIADATGRAARSIL